MRSLAFLAVALVALAGCSESGPDLYTCQKTGQVVDLATVEGSGADGFDPESACAPPAPPSVTFATMPAGMTVYFPSVVAWSVSPGNYTQGHSMLTQLRWSAASKAADQLAKPEDFGTLAQQYSHQDLPARLEAKLKFDKPGTYYLRAYAQVRGEGLPDTDFWTPEVALVVSPVNATGKTIELTREQGPALAGQLGKFGPDASAALGDAVVLVNADAVEHTFTFTGVCKLDDVTVAAGGRSDAILMAVPGTCNVKTDDPAGPQQASVSIAEPT